MDRVLIALGIAAVAVAVAFALRRRRPDAPTQSAAIVPEQLDRVDFARPQAPWLVAAFTSATCESCGDVAAKVAALESDDVAVDIVELRARSDLHERYRIDAVPMVVIAGRDGAVRGSFLGPVRAADLWSAVAEVRETEAPSGR